LIIGIERAYAVTAPNGEVSRQDYYTWTQFVNDIFTSGTPAYKVFLDTRLPFMSNDLETFWMNHRCQTVQKTVLEALQERKARNGILLTRSLE